MKDRTTSGEYPYTLSTIVEYAQDILEMDKTIKAQAKEIWELKKIQEQQKIKLSILGEGELTWVETHEDGHRVWTYCVPLDSRGMFGISILERGDTLLYRYQSSKMRDGWHDIGGNNLGKAKEWALKGLIESLNMDEARSHCI
jgi:hypothetical protein